MRRTKGGWLHPAIKWKVGEQSSERLVGDPAGVMRVNEPAGWLTYLPNVPDIDINTYHKQIDFTDARDLNTTTFWRETSRTDGPAGDESTPLALYPTNYWSVTAHARIAPNEGSYDYYQYQQRYASYVATESGHSPNLWFLAQARAAMFGTGRAFIGFASEDEEVMDLTRDVSRIGYFLDTSQSDYWQFIITSQSGERLSVTTEIESGRYMDDLGFGLIVDPVSGEARVTYANSSDGDQAFLPINESLMFWNVPMSLTIAAGQEGLSGPGPTLQLNYLKQIFDKAIPS